MHVLTSIEHLWSGPCVMCLELHNHGIFINIPTTIDFLISDR